MYSKLYFRLPKGASAVMKGFLKAKEVDIFADFIILFAAAFGNPSCGYWWL
jgi:hypothetical protein